MIDDTESFVRFLEWDTDQLWDRLARVCTSIVRARKGLGEARAREVEAKGQGWASSAEDTVRGREKSSSFAAIPATTEKFEHEAVLEALETEKEFLVFLLSARVGLGQKVGLIPQGVSV